MNNDAFSLRFTAPKMNADGDEAEVMLYGEIISGMPENWKWDKEDKSAADFDRAIKEAVRSGARKLLLRINSPGGILREAVAMRSTLNTAGFETVTIRIEGLCASAATVVATLPGAHVQIAEGSEFMVHNPVCGCYGYADDMEATAAYLRKSEEIARGFYTKRTGADEATVKAWMDAETW
ncbi:MAG: Clp protease ClpP, partial [Christensenellales bacterium]